MDIRIATIPDLKSIIEIYNQAVDDEFCTADLELMTIFQYGRVVQTTYT